MNKIIKEIPLKNRTAWSHLRTLQRARDIVKEWPDWKKAALVFRERRDSDQNTEASTPELSETDARGFRERSA